jgi:hypothetical protein
MKNNFNRREQVKQPKTTEGQTGAGDKMRRYLREKFGE